MKINVDVKEHSELSICVKDNTVIIEASHTERSNEWASVKKDVSYNFGFKHRFEPQKVTSTLSSVRMLSVMVPKTATDNVYRVQIKRDEAH